VLVLDQPWQQVGLVAVDEHKVLAMWLVHVFRVTGFFFNVRLPFVKGFWKFRIFFFQFFLLIAIRRMDNERCKRENQTTAEHTKRQGE